MICAEFYTTPEGSLLGFSISGHSGWGKDGSDIVCAAVSSAAFLVANTLTDILNVGAEVSARDGEMEVRIAEKDAGRCRDLLAGFKLHMVGLEEEYPRNINVSYTEV